MGLKMIAIGGLGVGFLLLCSCSSFLYQPDRIKYVDSSKLSHPPESSELRFGNQDVYGWYFHSTSAKPGRHSDPRTSVGPRALVLHFHGNAGNRTGHFARLYWMLDEAYDLAIFDYPGYGESSGSPTPQNTVASAMTAIRWAREKAPNLPLVVYGQSLGGAVAMRAVCELRHEIRPDVLIVDSSFQSYRQVARQVLAKHWFSWPLQPLTWVVLSDEWAPQECIRDLRGPVIVMHSPEDEVIPLELGKKIFETAPLPKQWILLEGSRHNSALTPQKRTELLAILEGLLPQASAQKK